MNTKNNKSATRLNLNANDITVSISGLDAIQSRKIELAKNVKKYVEINWSSGQFLVSVITEAGGKPVTMQQICRSSKPSYSFAAYFEACGSILI
jgi:hypothetical protein